METLEPDGVATGPAEEAVVDYQHLTGVNGEYHLLAENPDEKGKEKQDGENPESQPEPAPALAPTLFPCVESGGPFLFFLLQDRLAQRSFGIEVDVACQKVPRFSLNPGFGTAFMIDTRS